MEDNPMRHTVQAPQPTFSGMSGIRMAVVGEGTAALQVMESLRRTGASVQVVSHVSQLSQGRGAPQLVASLTRGVTPAYTEAMKILSQGYAWCTANPFVLQAHGTVLQAAAQGQGGYLGACAAGWGGTLQAGTGGTLVLAGGVNTLLHRQEYRAETTEQAERALAGTDLSGKTDHARAIALYASQYGTFAGRHSRAGLTGLTPERLRLLRTLGLVMRYGSTVTSGGATTGLLAVPESHPLAGLTTDNFLQHSALHVQSADEQTRAETGLLIDACTYFSKAKPVPLYPAPEAATPLALLGRHAAVREAAKGLPVLADRAGDGQLLAIIEAGTVPPTDDVLVVPVSGGWKPQNALRAVA